MANTYLCIPGSVILVLSLFLFGNASGQTATSPEVLRAFPGAEGFGTSTPGGRGGRVAIVTTLAWSGPGSFSSALYATGPRIIVFEVSGVIDVPRETRLLKEAHSYVTVAGQSSPGGITLRGGGIALKSLHQSEQECLSLRS